MKIRIEQLETFEAENKILRQENTELKDENSELKSKVEELDPRLNSNSHNSNMPPSSEVYKKKPALPKKKKGKQGGLPWLHAVSSLLYTYLFVHEKRGSLAIRSNKSILDRILGWLVHDCWRSYFSFTKYAMRSVGHISSGNWEG